MTLDQLFISLFGFTAILITQHPRLDSHLRWAPVLGLCSQPFWFYSSWAAGQWGIFIISFAYAWCWLVGIKKHWGERIARGMGL